MTTMTSEDLKALSEFEQTYPAWWWKIGVCSLTRDFDAAPEGNAPEIKYIENGKWPDECFSCDHTGTVADAIRDVMGQIKRAITEAEAA